MVSKNSDYAIETIGLTKIFPDWWGRAKVVAVDDLNLKVRPNEIYGFLGPNGSGKTTTLKMLLNLLHPTRGRAVVLGGNTADPKISSRIGYLPEDSYLYRYLSARETLDFYGRLFGLPSGIRGNRIETLLEMVGLSGMAGRPIGTFSKGMARRIGLAQALINDPDLLILDEPTSGMDPIGTRQIKDLLIQLAKRGKTILLCSHLLADVEDVCDRIGILYGGKMQVEGTVQSLLQHKEQKQILTGAISEQALSKIQAIIEEEAASCEVTAPMDKLEDYFVRIVAEAQKKNRPTSGAMSTTKITGFLAEETPKRPAKAVLDDLVSAKVEKTPTPAAEAELEKVEPVTEPEPAAKADNHLLEALTRSRVDRVEEESEPMRPEAAETQPSEAAVDEVKKDVLDSLIRKDEGQTVDGSTEATTEGQEGQRDE